MQLLGNRDEAADALQDALLTALGSKSIEQTHGNFKAWLLTVVRNRCLDILRQRKRRPQTTFHDGHDVEAADADPGRVYERHEQAAALRGELARLPPEQREMLILREYLDLSYAEVATVLSIPAGTVMSRLHRARSARNEFATARPTRERTRNTGGLRCHRRTALGLSRRRAELEAVRTGGGGC